ncbi:hypothetical protein CSUB01_12188 [Colletotrichum sublineola]|uniref:Uncharacterized protein n=1 Tax=Colletotrichum sublineola TaxID=1173701 RepID=A0A066XWK1_COLSU|nr:hypothetical protein CSUB01_12188 [Colletotrichum sublineola]
MNFLFRIDDSKSQPHDENRRRKTRQYPDVGLTNIGAESPGPDAGLLAPDQSELKTTMEEVMKFIKAYNSYTLPGLTESTTDQPKFDEVRQYGLSEEQESQLWQLETERLIFAATKSQSTGPFRFRTSEDWQADTISMEYLSTEVYSRSVYL